VSKPQETLILGVGAHYRGDDMVGLRVAAALEGRVPPGVTVQEASGEGTALMTIWSGWPRVIVVDACVTGAPPGSHFRLEYPGARPLTGLRCSSHQFGVAEALALAETLGQLPPSLTLHAIEGRCFDLGAEPSPEVAAAAATVAAEILAEVTAQ